MNKITQNNPESWLKVLWSVLEDYRENNIPEGDESDEQWDEICTIMAWIREELGLPSEVELEQGSGAVESYRVMAISIGHITQADSEAFTKLASDGDNMIMDRDSGFFIKLYGDDLAFNVREGV